MQRVNISLWVLLAIVVSKGSLACTLEYNDIETKVLVSRAIIPISSKEKIADTIREFNSAYGDGFGDIAYFYSISSPQKSINILKIKSDLYGCILLKDYFIGYCCETYKVTPELSERMRKTLLKESGIKEIESPIISFSSSSAEAVIDKVKKDA